ncbi:MAG: hypothetical protein AAGH40_14095 [Verrucomicrobiota bacterium]
MKQLSLTLLFLILTVSGCFSESSSDATGEKLWVYVQLNIEEHDGIDSDWLYGKIDRGIYESIQNGNTEGFFVLTDLRFWSTETEKITDYKDHTFGNVATFRREFIASIYELQGDPMKTYPPDEVDFGDTPAE